MNLLKSSMLPVIAMVLTCWPLFVSAQTPGRTAYKNERVGFTFNYDASYKLVDNSTADRFRVVLERETYFIYVALVQQSSTPGTPFENLASGFQKFSATDTAGKHNYRQSDLSTLSDNIAGNRAFTFSEYYSFDKGPLTNHFIFMEFPVKDKAGIAIRARTLNDGGDYQLANEEMMAVLASLKMR